ncbi:MAG: phenylalanine--tRNA ligase subunit beta [Acidobacteria bacterium]|nr:phenylalanine--tRNA ligase subunit beta [Acidobacteriota bacterium]
MRISPNWLREFVDITVEDSRLAEDLTHAGIAVESIVGSGEKTIFEMEITTNRVDAMNHYGVARECSAIYDINLKPITPKLAQGNTQQFPVEIREPELCGRYTARAIRDIRIEKSPRYIAERLLIEDHHAINNVADATNYTLMELGHPTHAFDLDRLEGGKIVVRRAKAGEKLKTLDGVQRELTPDDLVIAAAARPVGLAGIMGGYDTMITADTHNVLIESAWFDPATVRRTARRLGMHTDASHRFERGADWAATTLACDRVAELVLATGGGKLAEYQDCIARNPTHGPIQFDSGEVRRILGLDIPDSEVSRILRRLGFGLERKGRSTSSPPSSSAEVYKVEIPTWRTDVEREIDLIEEVARIHGFNNFANTLPSFSGAVVEQPHERPQQKLRARLLALGYDEAISPTFISNSDSQRFSSAQAIALENPLSDETPLMRNSLLPGMLDMIACNFNRGTSDIRLFELGNVFDGTTQEVNQHRHACFSATGLLDVFSVMQTPRSSDFFDVKGDAENLLALFAIESVDFVAPASNYFHPGRSAKISVGRNVVGELGQLHPDIAAERKFKQDVWLAWLDLDRLYSVPLREPRYERLSRYPSIERDFSLLLDAGMSYERLRQAIAALGIPELRSIEAHELFRGGAVPEGKYSLLLRLTFQSWERTLRDDDVAGWSQQVIAAVNSLGGSLRV